AVVFGAGASAAMALMPLVARDLVAGRPVAYGLLPGAFGFGAIAGVVGSARLRDRLSSEGLVGAAGAAFAVAVVVGATSSVVVLTMAGLVLGGAAGVLPLAAFDVTVQVPTPGWVGARALSLYQLSAFAGM